jgi:hypothetical protein
MRYARGPAVFVIVLTLLGLPASRAEHVHPAGIEGRTTSVVHTHRVDVASGNHARAYASHGDHRLAIFLTPIYETVVRQSSNPPNHPALLLTLYRHDSGTQVVTTLPIRPAHAPPGVLARASEGRAPPTLPRS